LKKLIIATTNQGKLKEIKRILAGIQYEILSLADFEKIPDIVEDGESFIENAEKKAREAYDILRFPVIADDSGLSVAQLGGRPGVYSARYAGGNASDLENNQRIISELKRLPSPHSARFICTAVYYDGNRYISATGELYGEIILEPRGSNGFGYDPLFIPEGFVNTLAELSVEEKNTISHRAKAFNKLKSMIQ
jgi:XTP/dITP diphosphohydrolase